MNATVEPQDKFLVPNSQPTRVVIPRNHPGSALLSVYENLYQLPLLVDEPREIPLALLHKYEHSAKGNFIVIYAYNQKYEVLLEQREELHNGWQLVGGNLRKSETYDQALERIIGGRLNLNVVIATPVAHVRNVFYVGSKEVVHEGLAYLVCVDGKFEFQRHNAVFLPMDKLPEVKLAYSNDKVAGVASQTIQETGHFFSYNDEVKTSHQRRFFHLLHHQIVRPLIHRFSSAQIRRGVYNYVEQVDSFIDIAVGDDTTVLDIANRVPICVANDISRKTYNLLSKHKPPVNMIFTNHDALDLPFKKRFDVCLAKNVFHHMQTQQDCQKLAQSIKNVCRRAIIVDIEDPQSGGFWARAWNSYYRNVLGDIGDYFLSAEQFRSLVEELFKGWAVTFDTVSTLKGNYLFAIADAPNGSEL